MISLFIECLLVFFIQRKIHNTLFEQQRVPQINVFNVFTAKGDTPQEGIELGLLMIIIQVRE